MKFFWSLVDRMEFFNYFKHRITSGASEGINRTIKTLKWQAYGYKDMAYFALKIMQKCGYLNSKNALSWLYNEKTWSTKRRKNEAAIKSLYSSEFIYTVGLFWSSILNCCHQIEHSQFYERVSSALCWWSEDQRIRLSHLHPTFPRYRTPLIDRGAKSVKKLLTQSRHFV